jgi:hypothetical protein
LDKYDYSNGTRAYDRACDAIAAIRQARGVAKLSMRVPVLEFTALGPGEEIEVLKLSEGDLRVAGRVDSFSYVISNSADLKFDVRI